MSFDKFRRWLETQNEREGFASEIRNGSTVHFSDEFAAHYDLLIQGPSLGRDGCIAVQMNLERAPNACTQKPSVYDMAIRTLSNFFASAKQPLRENSSGQTSRDLNQEFLKFSTQTWTGLGWELWYLDNSLNWMVVANSRGSTTYQSNDIITSRRIDFVFSLDQIAR